MAGKNPGRRFQFTIGGLLVAVAVTAVLINAGRPITRAEAVEAARKNFQNRPDVTAWPNPRVIAYQQRGGDGRHYWIVNFLTRKDVGPLVQVSVDQRGNVASTLIARSGRVVDTERDSSSTPLPP